MSYSYYDTHCHLNSSHFNDDFDAVIARMNGAGVRANVVGVDLETAQWAVRLAGEHEHLRAVVGQHPVDTPGETFDPDAYEALLKDTNVVAIGECGFDYFRINADDHTEKARQQQVFEAQIAFAVEQDKPLMLHCRPQKGSMDAYEDALALLEPAFRTHGERLRGNAHFFVGNWAIAKRFFDIGFSVSFPGIITFAREFDETVQKAPLDMLLAETDSPYAAPEPYRGKRNEPSYVIHVVEKLADIRGISVEAMREHTYTNGMRIFHREA